MNIAWDAEKYTENFSFVNRYGLALTDLIDGEGLRVLDLGCGNGKLTKALCDKGFDAEGMDSSEELLEKAEQTYPELRFIRADATDFDKKDTYDVVFSNAVFHWIEREKQPKMLKNVYNSLHKGGQFVFEFGGHGNNALIHEALALECEKRSVRYENPFYFPTVGEYAALLESAGFLVRRAELFDRPTELKGEQGMFDWLEMFVKTPFRNTDEKLRKEIFSAVAETLRPALFRGGKWYADYVRLRCKAVK